MKTFTLTFHTLDDDKDREEGVTLALSYKGRIVAQQMVGVNEVWPDYTDRAYTLTVPTDFKIGVDSCRDLKLRVYKQPYGSEEGAGWNMSLDAKLTLENGQQYAPLHTGRAEVGDGHPYDLPFSLNCQ